MNLEQDHASIAWGNFLAQYGQSPRLEAVVRALYAPLNENQKAIGDLFNGRWLDTAYGKQLDGIGEIVGQGREVTEAIYVEFFGFATQPGIKGFGEARLRRQHEPAVSGSTTLLDTEYRKILYWKIGINNGHGTGPEIAASVKAIFDASIVRIKDLGNAKMGVWFNSTPDTNPAMMVSPARWVPKAAGVGAYLIANTDTKPFGFINQGLYGFGEGIMARQV